MDANTIAESKNKYFLALLAGILLLALGFIFFNNIGVRPLMEWDESIYAQVAQQAFQGSDYLGFKWLGNTGLNRGDYWFEKPPLMIWLLALSYKFAGFTEAASRIWVSVFALLTAVLTGLFAKALKNAMAGILALAFFLVSFQFIYDSKILQFDIPTGFFILASVFFFYLAEKKPKYYYAFWAALALGVMTKSVIGLLPLPILFFYALASKTFLYHLRQRHLWFGSLLFLGLILPWHIYEHITYGRDFWNQYLFYHVLQRFADVLEGNNGNNKWYFYFEIIYRHRFLFLSSVITLCFGLYQSYKKNFRYLLPIIATLFILGFFTVSKTKLITYLLIIYSWLAILNGIGWTEIIQTVFKNKPRFSKAAYALICAGCVVLGLKYHDYDSKKPIPQIDADNKLAGLYFKQNHLDKSIYNYSTIGTKPSIIFYSNRVVYFLPKGNPAPKKNFLMISDSGIPKGPSYEDSIEVFSTPSFKVYHVK